MRSPISVLAIRGGPGRRSFDCGERRVGALKLQGLKLQFQVRRYAGAEESVSQLRFGCCFLGAGDFMGAGFGARYNS